MVSDYFHPLVDSFPTAVCIFNLVVRSATLPSWLGLGALQIYHRSSSFTPLNMWVH